MREGKKEERKNVRKESRREKRRVGGKEIVKKKTELIGMLLCFTYVVTSLYAYQIKTLN